MIVNSEFLEENDASLKTCRLCGLEPDHVSMLTALRGLTADGRLLLLATRFMRLCAYSGLSIVSVLYLVELGFTEVRCRALIIKRPETVIAWHRQGFRL